MSEDNPVIKVLNAVADADGVDTADLEPLYDYVDPGVIEALDAQDRGEWSFTFWYSDRQITLNSDGEVIVNGVAHCTES